jgi:TBC1 domain family protein 5
MLRERKLGYYLLQHDVSRLIDCLNPILSRFPDIPYYTDPYVRKVLRTILFLWAVENPDIQYRQGMHELLAVIMLVCDRDSLDRATHSARKSQSSSVVKDSYLTVPISPLLNQFEDGRHSPSGEKMQDAMHMVLDRRFLEHDVYGLFVKLMEHARSWYEWRTETVQGSLAQDQNRRNQVRITGVLSDIPRIYC